jgi:hypothetical protein
MVVRSRRHLEAQLGLTPPKLPISGLGTTYTMAQVAAWIDMQHYAVGRWDGTMSIFDFSDGADGRPKITIAVSTPSTEGVQMIEWLAPNLVATSNDDASVLLWFTERGDWEDIAMAGALKYPAALGVANSAACYEAQGQTYLAVGHASGYVTIWSGTSPTRLAMVSEPVDLTTTTPTNPWGMQNIRGLALLDDATGTGPLTRHVVSGSENGLICVVEVPTGKVLSRTMYNASAQRGINAVTVTGNHLAVANCAVGVSDHNFWYFVIDPTTWQPTLRSKHNLAVDATRPQVFNFDVVWCLYADGASARAGVLASTEEGYLWLTRLEDDGTMAVVGNQKITSPLGCALALNTLGQLAVSAYDLYNFQLAVPATPNPEGHPAQMTPAMLLIA